jgi:dihydrofolate synthase/folylpolyglutamate synthase
MRFSTFDQACSYMESFTNLEKQTSYTVRTYRLDRMNALLDHFDHPEHAFRSVHVAGSKGKGSTSIFIARGLSALGYKTGLYTSPHVETYRERFTMAGLFFDDHFLLSTAEQMIEHLETFSFAEDYGYCDPTTFELLTLLSFLLFSKSGCEYAVIETGLGGRLDATNVITPIISVITPIELEHTAILGDTLEQIAGEKAGIIKSGIPVCISYQDEQAMKVLTQRAEQMHSAAERLDEAVSEIISRTTHTGEVAHISWADGHRDNLLLTMPGGFQSENASLALLVLRAIGCYDREITPQAVSQAVIPGRMELIRETPSIYIDGAHTPQSLTRVYASFRQLYPEGCVLIFGAVEGKNHELMARLSLQHFTKIIISTPGTFKRSDPKALYHLFLKELGQFHDETKPEVYLIPDPKKALDAAVEFALPCSGVVLATGSFYMAAEIRQAVKQIEGHL